MQQVTLEPRATIAPLKGHFHVQFFERGSVIAEVDAESLSQAIKFAERAASEGGLGMEGPHSARVIKVECGAQCVKQA